MSYKTSLVVSVLAFATLGLYYPNDAFATCAKVLGCALIEPYPPTISQCSCSTATVTVKTNLSHHDVGLTVGDENPLDSLGQVKATGFWEIAPGNANEGTSAELTFAMTDVACSGEYTGPTDPSPPHPSAQFEESGRCDYSVRYEIPVVTCLGDSNLGHGNDCLGIDPDNNTGGPAKGKGKGGNKNAAFRVNQSCSESPDSTEARPKSIMTYKAFCEGEIPDLGRGVGGVTWRNPTGTSPTINNCTQYLLDPLTGEVLTDVNGDQIPNDQCTVQNGGFPTFEDDVTGERLVDLAICAGLFPAGNVNGQAFETGQVLFVQQEWLGECASLSQPPTDDQSIESGTCTAGQPLCEDDNAGVDITLNTYPRVVQAISRECSSDLGGLTEAFPDFWPSGGGPLNATLQFGDGNPGDGFDNQGPLNGNILRTCPPHNLGPAAVQRAAISSLVEHMTTETFSQVVNLKCDAGSDSGVAWMTICGTDDLDVADITLLKNPRQFDPNAPTLEGKQIPHDFEFFEAITGPCAGGGQDLRLKYFTCTAEFTGVAQLIWAKTVEGGECDGLADHETCPLTIQGQRSALTAAGLPVILQDVLDVEVNNVKAIPDPVPSPPL
jgi:hypothetical protein